MKGKHKYKQLHPVKPIALKQKAHTTKTDNVQNETVLATMKFASSMVVKDTKIQDDGKKLDTHQQWKMQNKRKLMINQWYHKANKFILLKQ